MRETVREIGRLAAATVSEFLEDDCMSMAAALAFYTMLSLPPLLLIVVTLVSALFPFSHEQVSAEVIAQINSLIGEPYGEQVMSMLEQAARTGPSAAATILGVALLVFAATGVLSQLQYSLNVTWQVEPDPARGGIRNFILKRALSMAMLAAIAFLLLVSLMVSTALELFHAAIRQSFVTDLAVYLVQGVDILVSLLVTTFLFGAIYKVIPDARITWRDVSVGSVVSALLFVFGKLAISFYLGGSEIASTYGAASALAVILSWVYYASLVVFLGAEFTQVWSSRHGTGLHPTRGAVRTVRRSERIRPGQELPPESKERRGQRRDETEA